MGFAIAECFVEIRGDTRHADRAVDAVQRELKALPPSTTVEFRARDAGLSAVIAETKRHAAELERARGDSGRFLSSGTGTGTARAAAELATLPAVKTVRITGDTAGLGAAVGRAKGLLGSLDLKGLAGQALGAAAAGVGLAGAAGAAGTLFAGVKGAADLAETQSKVEVVFGRSAEKVKLFGESMATAFGTSRQEVLDSAAGFGLIAKAAGQTQEQAANLSVDFARLADDASSFYNVPLEEALRTIKSALVGESEPIRRFGVLLNEDAVKAEALRLGLTKVGKELTESSKVMARASLIQKGMADAAGDHARTAGSFANQWREFTGRAYDLAVTVGGIVLPVLNTFLRVLNPIVTALQEVAKGIASVISKAGGLANAFSGGLLGGGAGSAAPGAGAGKALPPEALGGGATKDSLRYGLDAARKTVADERLRANQDRLETEARQEQRAADRKALIYKQDLALYKELWVQKTAAALRGSTNTLELRSAGQVADAFARARKDAEALYSVKFGGKSAADEGLAKGGADSTAQRNFIQAFASVTKEKIGQALDFRERVKQQGLGLVAKGAEAVIDAGAGARRDRERREGYQAEFFSGGQGLSQRIQAGALGGDARKEEKEIAKATAQTVTELKTGFAGLMSTLKDARKAVAAYQ